MPISPSQAARIHHDKLVSQHSPDTLGRARGPGVSYTRDFAEYSAGKKTLKILSYLTVVPLVIDAIRGKFQRRLTLSGSDLPGSIDTGINRTDWKMIRSAAHRAGEPAGVDAARDPQLRSIALKLIAATSQDTGGLKTALRSRDIPTSDLLELAVNCAHDKTGEYRQAVFDTLRSDLQTENKTTDRSQRFEAMRQQYLAADSPAERIGPVTTLPSASPGLNLRAQLADGAITSLKKLKVQPEHFDLIRPLIARLIGMPRDNADQRAQWLQSLVTEHKDAVRLLCLLPDLLEGEGAQGLGSMKELIQQDRPLIDALRTALGIVAPKKDNPLLVNLAKAGGVTGKLANFAQQVAPLKAINDIDKAIDKAGRQGVDGPRAQALADTIETEFVQRYDFSSYTAQLGDMVKDLPPDLEDLFKNVIQRYFTEQTPADKRSMLASLYQHGNSPEPMDHLVALLKGAGPFLQKMVQQMGSNVSSPSLAQALQQLKENLNPIDDTERLVLLHQVVQRVGGQGARLAEVRVLSSASVAETVAARLVSPGVGGGPEQTREVVIKLLRPGIESRAGRERAFFDRVAQERKQDNPDDAMAKTMGSIADQIESELDLRLEAQQIEAAQVYRARPEAADGLIQTMRMNPVFTPEAEFLILERMPGQSVKSLIAEAHVAASDPAKSPEQLLELENQTRQLCERIATLGSMWLSEAIYGSGFFHGDLHAGNLMVDTAQADRTTLGLIDFGNAATLDASQRRHFLRLQAAVMKGHPERATDALRELLPPASRPRLDEVRDLLVLDLKGLLARDFLRMPVGDVLSEFLSAGNRLGLEIPGVILQVGRSQGMLDKTFDDAHKVLTTLVNRRDAGAEPGISKYALVDSLESAAVGSMRKFLGAAGWGFGLAVVRNGDAAALERFFEQHPVGSPIVTRFNEDVRAWQARETEREVRLKQAETNREERHQSFTSAMSELYQEQGGDRLFDPDSNERAQLLNRLPEDSKDSVAVQHFISAMQMAGHVRLTGWEPCVPILRHLGYGEAFDQWQEAAKTVKALSAPEAEIVRPDHITAVLDHEHDRWAGKRAQQVPAGAVPPLEPGLAGSLGQGMPPRIDDIGELSASAL